jgi:prepilin-type N-terminal cleavage/methylation domain-containing protein
VSRGRTVRHGTVRAAGFTLLELLMSVLILGLILALVLTGAFAVTNAARNATDRATLANIRTGLTQFQQEFNFAPPLVKEQAGRTSPGDPPTNPILPASPPNQPARISVYQVTAAQDRQALRVPTLAPTSANPLLDNRYSEVSLAYYLVGALEEPLWGSGQPQPPIDGVAGPGLYRPARDGSFEIPADVRRIGTPPPGGQASSRVGKVYEPFINLSSSLKVLGEPGRPWSVRLLDRKGTPIRYYRWERGREYPAGSGNYDVRQPQDLNVPAIVGRDYGLPEFRYFKRKPERDLLEGAALKGATWAIVGAGQNGLFGDEDTSVLAERLGKSPPTDEAGELVLRAMAEEDNIVEVGQ